MSQKINLDGLIKVYGLRPIWRVYTSTDANIRIEELDLRRWLRVQPSPQFRVLRDSEFGIYIEEIKEKFPIY